MTLLLQILAHTPPFVFVLLAFLVWQGVRSLRPRRQAVWSLILLPACFSIWCLVSLLRQPPDLLLLAGWLAGCVALGPAGLLTGPRLLEVDRLRREVVRAGTPVPLVRNLVVFALQYGLAVAQALHLSERASLAAAGYALSGATLGYFAGWTIAFGRRYRAASDTVP